MESVVDQAGRIVLPKPIRDALGLLPGTKVDITPYGAGAQVLPAGRTARIVEEGGVLVADSDTPVDDGTVFALINAGPQVTVAVDTSVAVPLLVRSHHDHASVMRWWDGQEVALSGHALAETYSVLTRLPGDARLAPADAAMLLKTRFATPFMPSMSLARKLPDTLSRLGIAGGAVYDALVALAAKEHGASLATRDARARGTYDAVGVTLTIVT